MILFPYKKVVIETEMSPNEIRYNIKKALYKTNWMRFNEPETYDNVIEDLEIKKFKFATTLNGNKRTTKRYILVGVITIQEYSSKIDLTIRWSFLGILFWIYFLIWSFLALFLFISLLFHDNIQVIIFFILPIFIVIPYLNLYFGYIKSLGYVKSEFLNLLNGKLIKT